MILTNQRAINETAYRNLKPMIDSKYPKGRFVAIHGGAVVADARTLDELLAALTSLGKDPKESLAVQAGVDYPDYVEIL
jgi:hypothetical protein